MKKLNLKELQKNLLEILDDFVLICQKYDLKYFLAYGTVIGAVRHNGFIPWDDDIDVHMPIPDYLKFIEIANEELDQKKYFFQTIATDKYYNQLWLKIRMNNTLMNEKSLEGTKAHQGIFIDIFPLIPYPNDYKEAKKQDKKHQMVKLLLEKNMSKEWKLKYYGKAGCFMSYLFSFIPNNITHKIAQLILFKMFAFKGNHNNFLTFGPAHFFPSKPFGDGIKHQFEDRKYIIPKDYDSYLKKIYGDYMKLPPIDKRQSHGEAFIGLNKKKKE